MGHDIYPVPLRVTSTIPAMCFLGACALCGPPICLRGIIEASIALLLTLRQYLLESSHPASRRIFSLNMLTIRLTRVGKKKDGSFRVIVVESKRKVQPGNYL